MKKYLFLLVCVLFFGGAVFIFYHKATKVTVVPGTATSTPAEDMHIQAAMTSLKDWSTSGHYQIDVSYPTFTIRNAGVLDLNTLVRDMVTKSAADFKRNVAQMAISSEEAAGAPKGDSTLTGKAEAFKVDQATTTAFVSVVLGLESDMVPAAHPGHLFESIVYDVADTSIVSLDDLFTNLNQALSAISSFAKTAVKAQLASVDAEDSFIEEGVDPKEAYFKTFALTPDGIIFVFQEYQVAPYVSGPMRVTVPYAELRQYLTADIKRKLELD